MSQEYFSGAGHCGSEKVSYLKKNRGKIILSMMKKIIVLSSDHNGIQLKKAVKKTLIEEGFHCIDLGPYQEGKSVDYVDHAYQLGSILSEGDAEFGILICGTGIGMSIAVNRFDKVRAALAHNLLSAHKSREHNDANVLCLGAWLNNEATNLEIVKAWIHEKFGEYRHVRRVEKLQVTREEKLVFTNGIFDILHSGHINLLRFAKSLGHKLIVGINSDRVTKLLKGEGRPINCENDRKAILQSIQYVDEVVVFDDIRPSTLIQSLHPDIVVKGGEWTAEDVRKRDEIPDLIQIKIFPFVDGYSTTNVIKTIKSRESVEIKKENPLIV